MVKEKYTVSVPVWVTYTIPANSAQEAIEIAKFKIDMSHKGVLSEPHYDLLRLQYSTRIHPGE